MFPCLLSIVVLQDCSYVSVNLPQILKLVYVVAVAVGYSLQSHCQTDAFVEDSEMNSQVKSIVPCAASGQAPLEFRGFPNILFSFVRSLVFIGRPSTPHARAFPLAPRQETRTGSRTTSRTRRASTSLTNRTRNTVERRRLRSKESCRSRLGCRWKSKTLIEYRALVDRHNLVSEDAHVRSYP